MRVERCPTAWEFLEETLEYRAQDPLGTNVMGTVAIGASTDASRYDECNWWLVRDGQNRVESAAFRTTPHMLSLGAMTDDAAMALAARVAVEDPELPGVIGRPHNVDVFTTAFTSAAQLPGPGFVVTRRDVLYTVDDLVTPTTSGEAEVATAEDASLAESWLAAFAEEVDGARRTRNSRVHADLLGTLRDRRLYWWRDDDEIVSMAAHNTTVSTLGTLVTRVGPVFTPQEHRRHGYAAGVSAAVTTELHNRGSQVMLFADASNPTSNSVYQSLGYREVERFVLASRQVGGAP